MLKELLPFVVIFAVVFLLKRMNVVEKKDGVFVGKILFNVVIPAIALQAFSSLEFERSLLLIPVAALLVIVSMLCIGLLASRLLGLERKTAGSFVCMFFTMEGGMVGIAVMLAFFGTAGLSRFLLFDLVHAFFIFILAYILASWYGGTSRSYLYTVKRVLKTPIVWAIALGLLLNWISLSSALLSSVLSVITSGTLFLVIVLLALEFEPRASSLKLPFFTILFKVFAGIALGFLATWLLGIDGLGRVAVIIASSLPPSALILVYAQENGLDVDYVASTLSFAVPLGVVVASVLATIL
jgi:malate permease and related proteins